MVKVVGSARDSTLHPAAQTSAPLLKAALFRQPQPTGLRILIQYNPEAGRFSAHRLERLRRALAGAGHDVDVANGRRPQHGAIASRADVACLFGGDGTVRDVLTDDKAGPRWTRYIVYPAGTVNLIAREASYPRSIADFVSRLRLKGAPAREHYAGRIGERLFLCCASVGPDSAVVARVSPGVKRWAGRLAYLVALAALLPRWPRDHLTVTVDGADHAAEAAYVCKGRYYAGPWVLDDQARTTADTFRVLLLPRARRRDILRLALSAMLSHRLADPRWIRLPARRVEITAARSVPLQADGDPMGQTPVRMEIVPNPLPFV